MLKRVSIIIPTYNRADLLREAVDSVLSQDYENIEVVVADDGSTDNTAQIVQEFGAKVKYVRQENSGVSAARNLGTLHSSGDYLLFLDSDDLLLPGAISKLAGALDGNPQCGAAYCGFVETRGHEEVQRSPLDRPSGNVLVPMLTEYLCIVHSVMLRRECVSRIGLFDAKMSMYEDMDFNVRLAANYEFVFVQEHLVVYRLAHSQASQLRDHIAEQRRLYLHKVSVYRYKGVLNRREWRTVLDRIYGIPRGRKNLWDAYEDFATGRNRQALKKAFAALVFDPRFLFSRTWISFTGKALLRNLGVPMKG